MPNAATASLCGLTILLAISQTLSAMEAVERKALDRDGQRHLAIYQGEQLDGRIILAFQELDQPSQTLQGSLAGRVARWVGQGALVAVVNTEVQPRPTPFSDWRYEKLWRGTLKSMSERLPAQVPRRLIFMPPDHDLSDPIPFYAHGNRQLVLDIVYPIGGRQTPALLRVESGTFGADLAFWLADNGFAMAQIPDPFYDLNMDGETAIAYARAAASALRAQQQALGLNGRIGLMGKSKHGFASAVMAAGATHQGSDPNGDIQAVIAQTDTLDPATRHEDFIAAGIRSDGNPGNTDDPRGSPVHLLQPGGPAFFLCPAHGRTTRQSLRLIEALERHGVPYQQTWYDDRPQYVPMHPTAVRAFLLQHLSSPSE